MLTHVDVYSLTSQHYFGEGRKRMENERKGGKWREMERLKERSRGRGRAKASTEN